MARGFDLERDLPRVASEAQELGASALWYQSGRNSDGTESANGYWLPDAEAERVTTIAESAGLSTVHNAYIADIAAQLEGRLFMTEPHADANTDTVTGPATSATVLDRLTDGELLGSDLAIVEWTAEPSTDGSITPIAPLHVHYGDDEAWYVLSGRLSFSFNGESFDVPAGGAALATAGTVHTYWNATNSPTRYLLITTRRIRELVASLHDPDKRRGRSTAEVFRDYNSELIAP